MSNTTIPTADDTTTAVERMTAEELLTALEGLAPPEEERTDIKATLKELRARAKALGYKTIHRRGNDYHLVDLDGDRRAGGEGLDGMAATLDHMEAFEAGAVNVITTACGVPMSASDKNGPIELDDPRVAAVLAGAA